MPPANQSLAAKGGNTFSEESLAAAGVSLRGASASFVRHLVGRAVKGKEVSDVRSFLVEVKPDRLPPGCDATQNSYKWVLNSDNDLQAWTEGHRISDDRGQGLLHYVVTRDNHPDVPSAEFHDNGLLVNRHTQLVLVFCPRAAATYVRDRQNEIFMRNVGDPNKGPQKARVGIAQTGNDGEFKIGGTPHAILGVENVDADQFNADRESVLPNGIPRAK